MKNKLLLIIAPLLLTACFPKKKPVLNSVDEKMELMDADRAFSKMIEEKGMRTAFMEYVDSNGVLLRPNTMPMVGAEAIDFISQDNDSVFTLKWEPRGGSVAQSGDLGYTYGIYAVSQKQKDTVIYGTYVNVWRKQPDGQWKFVLNTGNDGIGE